MNRKHLWIRFGLLLLILLAALAVLWHIDHPHFTPESKPAMYIEPAQSPVQRSESFYQTYDFRLNSKPQSVLLEIWELQDGQWINLGGGRIGASLPEGQFTLAFNSLIEGFAFAAEGADYTCSVGKNHTSDFTPEAGSLLYTSLLFQLQEITCETPVPMAIQLYTSNQNPRYIGVDFFHQPELIAAEGHDHVFAATLTFSQIPME